MIAQHDFVYDGLPWLKGGRTRAGLDCAGLALLFLKEELGIEVPAPPDTTNPESVDAERALQETMLGIGQDARRGDLVFFRHRETRKICHVGVLLEGGKLLHIVHGCTSRIDNGFALTKRLKLDPVGIVRSTDAPKMAALLAQVGDVSTIVAIVIAIVSAVASYLLTPKLGRQGNRYGRYGFDALVTKNTPEIPLPDLLGSVVVAGNSPYTQLKEAGAGGTAASQKANKIVIFASAECEEIDYQTGLKVNGYGWNDPYFYDGTQFDGMYINPPQTKAAAVTGTILGESNVPSISLYTGAYATSVPVDVRAQYDREFPLYGFSGCSYAVFRLIDSSKFQNFNVTCRVKGRKCRKFDENGFLLTDSGVVNFVPDGVTTRFDLGYRDVDSIGLVSFASVGWTEMSASNQTGLVYSLNKTKGYIECLSAPASGGVNKTLNVSYYEREWTQNPASHLVYLLTEKGRGLGLTEDRIDWAAANDLQAHCAEVLTYQSSNGEVAAARWLGNYAIDFRKPIQEHIQAILDACHAVLFLSGGKWVMKAITAESSVFSFTTANILEGSFSSELIDRAERANRIKVLFHSEEAHNAESEVIADNQDDQRTRAPRSGNNGVVDANLKLEAVTNPAQAERLALAFLEEEVGARQRATWKTNVKGLALQIGDVVDVTHPSRPSWAAKLLRIDELSHDTEDRLEIVATEYTPGAYL